jgi:hypothetical protein
MTMITNSSSVPVDGDVGRVGRPLRWWRAEQQVCTPASRAIGRAIVVDAGVAVDVAGPGQVDGEGAGGRGIL